MPVTYLQYTLAMWIYTIQLSYCGDILFVPLPTVYSHINEMLHIGIELIKMGHSVDIIVHPLLPNIESIKVW